MKKKSIVMLATGIVLVASLVIGGTLAFFTDTKTVSNNFTVGDGVNIRTDEAKVDPDTGKETGGPRVEENTYNSVTPGQILDKDPMVTNESDIPVFVRMVVTLTEGNNWLTACRAHEITVSSIFEGVGENWALKEEPTSVDQNGNLVFAYEYNGQVEANSAAPALFTNVVIPSVFTGDEMQTIKNFKMNIVGGAIQATGYPNGVNAQETGLAELAKVMDATPAQGE